jgi:hypothetical protein
MYRLREFEQGDLDALAGALPDSCGDTARELGGHPAPMHGVIVEGPRGGVAACLVALRHELVTDTRTIGLGIVRLAHVAEEARIGGIHSLLFEVDRAFAERFEGPERAFQAVVGQWHEQDVWWLRRLCDYEPIAQSITFEGPVGPASIGSGTGADDLVVEAVEPAAVASMAFPAGPATGLRRSRESFAHGARQPGRRAWIARRSAQVLAWAVLRDEATAVLEDHTIDWRDGRTARALLAAAAAGRRLRATRWTNQEGEFATLQAAGLRVRGPERLIAARVSAFGIAPASLAEFASFGDSDVGSRALPRLSHSECVATPPPPGTRSTHGDHRRSSSREHQPR